MAQHDDGRLTLSNTELTHKVKTLYVEAEKLKLSIKSGGNTRHKSTLLPRSSGILPISLIRGILIVPKDLAGEAEYTLPSPQELTNIDKTREGYDFHIRNDSGHPITLSCKHAGTLLDGQDQVAEGTGSTWHLSYTGYTPGDYSYEVTRLT